MPVSAGRPVAASPATSLATDAEVAAAFTLKTAPPYEAFDSDYRQIPVVMLHEFASEVAALGVLKDYAAWGYETIFFSELVEYLESGDATGLPSKPLVLCDDDGGASSYDYLYPALQTMGMKCTYFLVPDWIDGTITEPANGGSFLEASSITWAEAQTMFASGLVEFQAHTTNHGSMRAMTGVGTYTADLSADGSGAGADYLAAKATIEENIPGVEVIANAVPYGVINATAIASMRAAGCRGQRITFCGKGLDGSYDGSGQPSYTYPTTDPLIIPNADSGNFKHLKRHNIFGMADADGNRFENGKFTISSRGTTLSTGWTFTSGVTLPQFADPATGYVLRGSGTNAANTVYHTNMIPVGFWGTYEIDWWTACSGAPSSSVQVVVECYANPYDETPVTTKTDPAPIGGTTGWTRRRWINYADGTWAWLKVGFKVANADSDTVADWWDVRVRCPRSGFDGGL